MQSKKMILITIVSLFLFSACGYNVVFKPIDLKKKFVHDVFLEPPDSKKKLTVPVIPMILPYRDIKKKKIYIQSTKNTLKLFASIADNAGKREESLGIREELCREARKYIKIYVKPILNDSEAIQHLETKLEIAKLHLLTVILYFDLALYNQAQDYLNLINKRYGDDLAVLDIIIDQTDIGFSTIAEGIKDLQNQILFQTKGKKNTKKVRNGVLLGERGYIIGRQYV
ncbi:MAG: hypothetical protein HF982_10560 [Desulfobacteraceae bacterium]|nr:hypothetical protein [Desulfobacteraceae bacterium]MBC2720008.1 hypothetical protein [Desulfobacteraceae bacterium]